MSDRALRVLERAAATGDPMAAERHARECARANRSPVPLDARLIGRSSTGKAHLVSSYLTVCLWRPGAMARTDRFNSACGQVRNINPHLALGAIGWSVPGGGLCKLCRKRETDNDGIPAQTWEVALSILLGIPAPDEPWIRAGLRRIERVMAQRGRWLNLSNPVL